MDHKEFYSQDGIKGIKLNNLETKLLQFADDTTVVLSDLDSARALFVLLDRFEKVSGLKLMLRKQKQCGSDPSKTVKMNHLESNGKPA